MVGTTTTSVWDASAGSAADNGISLLDSGTLGVSSYQATPVSGFVAAINRTGTDGNLVIFRKDGATVGRIASSGDSGIIVGTTDVGLRFRNQSAGAAIFPRELDDTALDNAVDLGTSGSRFKDLYLSGSVYLGGTTSANALDDYEEGTWDAYANRHHDSRHQLVLYYLELRYIYENWECRAFYYCDFNYTAHTGA
jgi:hypothetical protein